jgi:hypothetical protein
MVIAAAVHYIHGFRSGRYQSGNRYIPYEVLLERMFNPLWR